MVMRDRSKLPVVWAKSGDRHALLKSSHEYDVVQCPPSWRAATTAAITHLLL